MSQLEYNEDIYYHKYIKYKTKYLEAKNNRLNLEGGGDEEYDIDADIGSSEKKLKWFLRKEKMKKGLSRIKESAKKTSDKIKEKIIQPTANFIDAIGRSIKNKNPMELVAHVQSQIANTLTALNKAPLCDIRTRSCDLNKLWEEKCIKGSPPEWADSLFCALGEGNQVASMIFRMRFVAPSDSNKHLLKTLLPIVEKTLDENKTLDDSIKKAIKNYLKTWNDKIDRGEAFSWSDLPALAMFGLHFESVENMIESSVNPMGMSFSDKQFSTDNSLPTRTVDLNALKSKCQQEWKGTLFCALAESRDSHLIARLISKMQFAPAELYGNNPNNHFIKKGIDAVLEKVKKPDPKTGKQSWTMWAAEKGINRQLSTILNKLQNNQLLSWEDMASIFQVATMDVSGLAEKYIPSNIQPLGLDMAKK